MNKRVLTAALLSMILVIVFCVPAMAGTGVKAIVNGDSLVFENGFYVQGFAMVPVEELAEVMGASVEQISGTQVKLVENDLSLLITTGSKNATFGTSTLTLPKEPVIIQGSQINIPLRFVAELFGFKAEWNSQAKAVSLERNETRDGMTAMDILVKSGNTTKDVDAYFLAGNMDIDVNVSSQEEGAPTEPVKMTSTISGQINNEPIQIYMKQNITPQGDMAQAIPETIVETYMTEDKMYIKMGDTEWMAMEGPFSPEFWEQQKATQNDPLAMTSELQKSGICINLGNDITLDGKDYYVINAALDLSKATQEYKELMQQTLQSVIGSNAAEMQQQIESLLANSKFDYRYTILINKETWISDIIKINADIDFSIDVPAAEGQEAQTLKINEKIIGEFNVFDFGKPFAAPDVSKAQPFELPME